MRAETAALSRFMNFSLVRFFTKMAKPNEKPKLLEI